MKLRILTIFLFAFLFILGNASISFASPELEIESELDFWWTVYEGNENGLQQESTQDPAADSVSGFNIKKGRLSFIYDDVERRLGGKFLIRFEEKVDVLDLYLHWYPDERYQLYFGQMKVPSTYEALTPNEDLDFISRGTLASLLTDWSLSRTSFFSTFYGNKSVYRDAGIGLKGTLKNKDGIDRMKYFFMIANGLGHSLYIGGPESKEFIYTNEFGDYFYGLRVDVMPSENLIFGGHYSLNKHDNVLFNDERTVFDLDRRSYSIDFRFENPSMRCAFMYGGGVIDDDFFHTGVTNLDYSGWDARIFVPINDSIEAGLRFDNYSFVAHESPNRTNQNNITLGLNYLLEPDMRLQVNYVMKDTDNSIDPDLDDDIFFINFQYIFNSGNLLDDDSEEDNDG